MAEGLIIVIIPNQPLPFYSSLSLEEQQIPDDKTFFSNCLATFSYFLPTFLDVRPLSPFYLFSISSTYYLSRLYLLLSSSSPRHAMRGVKLKLVSSSQKVEGRDLTH